LFSLRVKAIFFAMITLAVASFFAILASQLSGFTGGEDGITFKVPELLRSRIATYYLVFGAALALFLVLLRIVNSPFGRVLQAIRENEFRAEALGYRTVIYRTLANCLGAVAATLAGVLYALWLRYTGPNTTLDFGIMIDILLMVVIGGMGTMYGAVIGAAIFVVAQNYLQEAMKALSGALTGLPLLPDLFHPDRWLLWLGYCSCCRSTISRPASSASCAPGRRPDGPRRLLPATSCWYGPPRRRGRDACPGQWRPCAVRSRN
jgi:branched-chain amino acid transport system permease protein